MKKTGWQCDALQAGTAAGNGGFGFDAALSMVGGVEVSFVGSMVFIGYRGAVFAMLRW